MENNVISNILSTISLVVSLSVLFLLLKNRKTNLSSYRISRHAHRSSEIDLVFVCSNQLDDSYVLKLVLFNPGQISAILKSFTVFKEVESTNFISRLFGFRKWEEITEAIWWPTENDSSYEIKTVADKYQKMLVNEQRDIMVSIPGNIDRNRYKFLVKTNNGGYIHCTTINATKSYFPHKYDQWYNGK